jgi:DNA repair protein RecN (Recombination protein N)
MLRELSIKNFAIIDDLRIRFQDGLTVLTGETGAGKTIIVQAVRLLLGSRADAQLIRTGARHAELEALFDIDPDGGTARQMAAEGYDVAEGLLVRRRLSANHRHRIYINDRLATAAALNAFTAALASIAGQHAHQDLLREDQQIFILDQYGGLDGLRRTVRNGFRRVTTLLDERARLRVQRQRRSEQLELLDFQRREIEAAAIEPGEDDDLEREKQRLRNAGALYSSVQAGVAALYDEPGAAVERISEVHKQLAAVAAFDRRLEPTAERLAELSVHLEDATAELRAYLRGLELDDGRLEAVEARLDQLNRLKRKYGGSLDAVRRQLAAIRADIDQSAQLDDRIVAVEDQLTGAHGGLVQAAAKLSRQRLKAAADLARRVERELSTLKMARTRFEVERAPLPVEVSADPHLVWEDGAIGETGIDRVRFQIAPNVGEALKPLAGIASGGELSRMVLALKTILAQNESVATVVFDEVDAGIGGSVAEAVGLKLQQLGRRHQVICITHLPQIAKCARHHFRISKQVRQGRTRTLIEPVRADERVQEIARMMSGDTVTPTTLQHARELLQGSAARSA